MSEVNPAKIPSGKLLSRFPYRFRLVMLDNPEKSPDFRAEMSLLRKSKLVIAARCVAVTSAAAVTPGTAATIASRT